LTYLLDTNAVVALLRNRPARVRERLLRAASERASIVVSAIVLFELWYGVARSGRPEENSERLRAFLSSDISIVSFEDNDAAIAGDLRAHLEASGNAIGPYDLLIASQALRTNATLVTANTSEFARVPGLVWEDWSVDS
jgi:tRNA(fMet)-specific endonuclease VapC